MLISASVKYIENILPLSTSLRNVGGSTRAPAHA